jgi:hypothetical protein
VIKHCGCDKHVRDRASDKPGLKRHNHSLEKYVFVVYVVSLPMPGSSVFVLWQIARGYATAACEAMFNLLWKRGLTYAPPINAAVAPTIEDWAYCEISSRIRQEGNITKQIKIHSHHDSFFPSNHIRYTKKNWTHKETMDPIIGMSKAEAYGIARWFISPNPETNQ